jgi:hypothetical protein
LFRPLIEISIRQHKHKTFSSSSSGGGGDSGSDCAIGSFVEGEGRKLLSPCSFV